MAKQVAVLRATERHTPASPEMRRWIREFSNPRRVALGLPPLEDEEHDEIPELQFFERARERGMLPRREGGPRTP